MWPWVATLKNRMLRNLMEEKRSTPSDETDLPTLQFFGGGSVASANTSAPTLLARLVRGKWLLLSSVLVFSLLGLMLGAVQVPLYKAQASIELQGPEANYRHARLDQGDGSLTSDSYIQTQIRIIQSRSLVERVLAKLNDAEKSRILESPRFGFRHPSYDQDLESIVHNISARPSQQAGIVDISFLSPDPVAGAHFLNSLTQELADFNIERTWHAAQRNREWTDRELDELRRKWEQSELVLAEYSETSGIGLSAGRTAQIKTRLSPVSRNAPATHILLSRPGTLTEANDPKLRELKGHLADLNKQIEQWQSLYGSSNPTVTKLRSEIAVTDTAIRQRHAALVQNARPGVQPATPDNSPPGSTPQAPAAAGPQALAHFNILKQDADSNRQIYETAAARLKEANVASASRIGDISVVDPAIPVTQATTPNQLMNGLVGALAGLIIGLGFIILRDRFSQTFSQPALLREHLRLDVLGAIPTDRFRQPLNDFTNLDDAPSVNLSFATDAQTAEAYRSIRSSILLKISQPSRPRRLVFTSAVAAEGKTSVVGNLGAALAGAQRRVLLVDGDLRNPGLHKLFGADNEHGLTDLLSHQLSAEPVTKRDVIRETQVPDLYLLSAGQAGARASEILSSVHLPELIREFAKGFDLVLIDSPPVLPYADARSLAKAADAVILIVKAGSTARSSALLARDAIAQDGAPIVGTILTAWDNSQSVFA